MSIMFVLITKLRASTSIESRQYRKAAKALLVLIPLLGLTYVLLLVIPASGNAKVVFTYLQATLYSTQGLLVAVLYCFLNGEVRQCLRLHLTRWRTHRLLSARPAASARGSNASHTTGVESHGTRHNSSAFTTNELAGECNELRFPLRTMDDAYKFNFDHEIEPNPKSIGLQQATSVDIRGRTQTLHQSSKCSWSIYKRLVDLLNRCRRFACRNRSNNSKVNTLFVKKGDKSKSEINTNQQSFLAGEDKQQTPCNIPPLNLTTKISIEINCSSKPLYSYSPVHVKYSEQPL